MGLYIGANELPKNIQEPSAMTVFLYGYLPHLIVLLIGVICAALGVRLLRSAGSAFVRVIPRDDFPVLAEAVVSGKAESIDQYVRLSSLSGFTGAFTKLGLTGLPPGAAAVPPARSSSGAQMTISGWGAILLSSMP